MPATICPYCKAITNFTIIFETTTFPQGSGMSNTQGHRFTVQRCNNEKCEMPAVLSVDGFNNVLQMWPQHVGGKQFPDVPPHIAEAADEAYQCFSINAYRGAVLLARSVVESTAKAKGITQGKLFAKIDEMHKQGLIRQYVRDGAQVRYLANDMAHGDFVDHPVDVAEAELVLTLMDKVLDEVFQSPAQVAKAMAARLAKAQQASTE